MEQSLRMRMFWCGGVFIKTILLFACTSPVLANNLLPISENITKSVKVAQNLPAPLEKPQPDPNEERFLQPLPQPSPTVPTEEPPVIEQPSPSTEPESPSEETEVIPVKKIEVTGNTIFGSEVINPIIQPLQGRSVTQVALEKAVQAITDLYIKQGYITSYADLDENTLGTEIVRIKVIEASIQEIRVEGTRRLNPNYVRSRIRLGIERPVNANKLEAQLRLLRLDPLFESVEASLQRGTGQDQSILTVRVKEAEPLELTFGIDNYTPPSIAPERASVGVSYRNLTGIGDEIAASYAVGLNLEEEFSRAALNIYDFSYRVPLNPLDGTLQFRVVPYSTKITEEDFDEFGIRGSSEVYELSYRQPVIKTLRKEFALSLGLTFQDGQTFVFNDDPTNFGIGPDENGISRTRVLRFGQDYISRDPQGTWVLRSQLNFGLNVFNATENQGAIPDGSFFSVSGQVQRFQQLGNDYALIIQGSAQLAADPLLPSQQFFIGGGQSLRGYRQSVRAGDNGVLLSVEGRVPLQRNRFGTPVLQLAPFVDIGKVWNISGNPNALPDQTFLASAGLGFLWQPTSNLNLRLDLALPFVNLDDRRDSLQDDGIYFSMSYSP